jgi:lipopolysaccharide biosynthesis regulator YciM
LQDIPKAIDAYERAIHLEKVGKTPPSEDPYVEYAVLMANQGETEKSISLLKEGLSKNPRSARANFELGRVLFKAGQLENAESFSTTQRLSIQISLALTFFWASCTRNRTD